MSDKKFIPAQNCDLGTLGAPRKIRKGPVSKKPQTEVVVQLGPYTDGQITSPELVRPLEGPTEWIIKPRTGEISPFDSGTPPKKDVIRKYITVGAQDNAPEALPKISDGYVIERAPRQDPLGGQDVERTKPAQVQVVTNNVERVVPETITKTQTQTVFQDRIVEKEVPVIKEVIKEVPVIKEVIKEVIVEKEVIKYIEKPCEPCDKPKPDAKDDCATANPCKPPIIVDVLKNDVAGTGSLTITNAVAGNGSVKVVNGKLEYTAKEGFYGKDVVTYTIKDGSGLSDSAQVYIDVPKPIIDAKDDQARTEQGKPVTIDVLANDIGEGQLVIKDATAANGTVSIVNGKLVYTPKEGFVGQDVIKYTLDDENCTNDSANVYVKVDPKVVPRDSTVDAKDDCVTADPCKPPIIIDVLKNDVASDGPLTIKSATAANGTVKIVGDKLEYTAKPGFYGDDTITYTATDKNGVSDTAKVLVDIKEPIIDAKDDQARTEQGKPVTIDVLANDIGEGQLVIKDATAANGTVSIVNGKLVYTPKEGFVGQDVLKYTLDDAGCTTDSANVYIKVDPKVVPRDSTVDAKDDCVTADPCKPPIIIDVLKNDVASDGPLTIKSATAANGTVKIVDGKLEYTAKSGFYGDDTITYTATDKNGISDTAKVLVDINEPIIDAKDDYATTQQGKPVTIDALKNDIGEAPLSIKDASASNGTVSIVDGKLLYTPKDGFSGKDVITYTLDDGGCLTDNACVFVDVVKTTVPNDNCPPKDTCEPCKPLPSDCPPNTSPLADLDWLKSLGIKTQGVHDQEYSSVPFKNDVFQEQLAKADALGSFLGGGSGSNSGTSSVSSSDTASWSSKMANCTSCAPTTPPPVEEHAVVC